MAREINQIIQELESAYAPQKKQIQEQISALPSYYQSQVAGLEQARQNAYQDIVRRANARGVAYSGAPIQEQQVYTGERYLPALAGLRQQEGTQTFNLQQALGKIGETQRLRAEEIRQQELNREEAARQAELNRQAQERAARAAGGGGGFGGLGALFGGGGGGAQAAQAQAQGPDWGQAVVNVARNAGTNPWVWSDLIRDVRKNVFGGGGNYGEVAGFLERSLGAKISSGSAADLALRGIYLGTPLNQPRQGTAQGNRQIYRIGQADLYRR
jgi:hypothetical protein